MNMAANPKSQYSLDLAQVGIANVPKFSISDDLDRHLRTIERERWSFDRLMNPEYEGWLRRRAFVRSGHHSLHIEGNKLTENQVANILENPTERSNSQEEDEVRNWNRAMQFVDAMSRQLDIPISSLLIRHIHQLMLGPNDRVNKPGEYRPGDAQVRHPMSGKIVYTASAAGDVHSLMDQLSNWLTSDASQLNPLLVAGIAHFRLVEIHPFSDGNGRTARALTTLILQRHGYSFNKLLALERYFDADLLQYCEAIGKTVGDRFEEGSDLTQWLEYFTFALSVEIRLVSDDVTDLQRMLEWWHSALSMKGYSGRHQDILAYAMVRQGIRPREAAKVGKVSLVTAGSDLKRLLNEGLLTVKGYGRTRVYQPSEEFWKNIENN